MSAGLCGGRCVPVHRAAVNLAINGSLSPEFFDMAYGAFELSGGDIVQLAPAPCHIWWRKAMGRG